MSVPSVRLMRPNSVFRRPPQTSTERNPGIAYGMMRSDRLHAPEVEAALVEHDGEKEAERERQEHGESGVDDRPDEDADERVADERVGEDLLEVVEADVDAPPLLEHLARRVSVGALAVVV